MQSAADILTLATCRADPNSTTPHTHVPLAAGRYRVVRVERATQGGTASCGCAACEANDGFIAHGHASLPSGPVVVVVHGFNCTENDGIQTVLNTRSLLAAWGVPIAPPDSPGMPHELSVMGFTWPCEHTLTPGYVADKESVARFAAFSLANLITDLHEAEAERPIAIIAHSMGCFLTLKSLNMLAVLHDDNHKRRAPLADLVVWLAPDINADALERSTPATIQSRWRSRRRERFPIGHRSRSWRRPVVLPETEAVPGQRFESDEEHPLDGYGYAAAGAVRHLAIYSSLRDEALWISPWANHFTEEAGAASGNIRLGWCGPLHPGLVVAPDGGDLVEHRTVALVDCTAVVAEHGDYFYHPIPQRDIAARVAEVLHLAALTPPTERQQIAQWHEGAPLVFPPQGTPVPAGLMLEALQAAPTMGKPPTEPRSDAPSVIGGLSGALGRAWTAPVLSWLLGAAVSLWRRYYRV